MIVKRRHWLETSLDVLMIVAVVVAVVVAIAVGSSPQVEKSFATCKEKLRRIE